VDCLFGEVRQIGFVSREIGRSMHYFIEAWGVGPWYVLRNLKTTMVYNGVFIEPEISIALANCGDLQFEIVEQHNEVDSLYTRALAATSEMHVQHVGVWAADFDAVRNGALEKGWVPILETVPIGSGSCFVAHSSEPMVCIEISDCSGNKSWVREAIRNSARGWDGADPIREGLPA
jgi:hypothetical protein